MRLRLLALGLLLVGCASSNDDDYPVRPGGGSIGGGGGGGGRDGGVADGGTDGGPTVGRVCLIADLRQPTSCAGSGAGNLLVQRGTAMATTRADGRFELPAANVTGDRWLVSGGSGSTLVRTVVPFTPGGSVFLPIVAQTTWDAMRAGSGITPLAGTGAIHVLSLLPSGSPKLGATVTVTPSISSTYYPNTSATVWSQTVGTTSGVSLVPNLTAGQAVDLGGAAGSVRATLLQQPIEADSITWVTLDFGQ